MSAETNNNQNQIVRNFAQQLERMKPQIQQALPKHLSADRMARIALTEFRKNPKLGDCNPQSVFASIIMASQLGLEPGVMGHCYLIPYKGECTFVPGWQGIVDLVSRTGRGTVWTGAAFQGDEFEYQYGDRPFVHHKPCGEDDPKKLTYAYAIGRVNGSDWPVIEVWPAVKIWKHRDRFNKVGARHYSFEHAEMYARKVVLLQVTKYMPKSAELTVAVNLDAAANEGKQGITIEGALDKQYEPPTGNDETTEQRELRESCEELLQKQGLNPAQIEAKISQHKGKLDQLLATLQKNTKTNGGSNGGANSGTRSTAPRGSVVPMDTQRAAEAEEPSHGEDRDAEDRGAAESAGEPEAGDREVETNAQRSSKRSTKNNAGFDWTV